MWFSGFFSPLRQQNIFQYYTTILLTIHPQNNELINQGNDWWSLTAALISRLGVWEIDLCKMICRIPVVNGQFAKKCQRIKYLEIQWDTPATGSFDWWVNKGKSQMDCHTSVLADNEYELHRWNGWISSSTWSLYLWVERCGRGGNVGKCCFPKV